jgi:predicted secreted protein
MSLFGLFVVFVVVWWLAFFAVLPWGLHHSPPTDKGHDAGAPANPRLWVKAAVTTLIALALTFVVWLIIQSGLITFQT